MLRKSLFLSLFLSFSLFGSDYLENVFAQPQQRTRIASFIDNVLRQVPSERFLEMVDNSGKSPNLCDAAFYEYMRKNFPSIKNRFAIRNVLKLVSFQKNLLAGQINQLIDANYAINNCLEIGTPGTYMECLKPRISGNIYVVNDQPKYSDRLQAYSFNVRKGFKGYDKFVKLNNYEPIDSSIADNSLDLVICFIGLHHIPAEKLDAFVHSIRRVLRPGGVFLLREHDASSQELFEIAYAAHSVFNVVIPYETVETEMKEIRNFKPLAQWIELLETVGFEISSERLLQEGDSSMNTMIKCTKKCITQSEQEFCAVLDVNKTHKDYHRDPVQKYLTIPEWNNVDAAQHYGQFIEHTPFYEFPYVGHISSFWKAFAQSWRCAAQEKGGHLKLLLSPSILFNYTLMNLFVGVSSTVEYSLKAIISWPIRAMLSGVEASTLLVLVNDPSNEIAALDPSIVVQKQYTEGIKLVEMPRYIKFRNVVKKMMNSSISFIEIAGNDHILCKVRSAEPLELKNSWQQKFTWTMPTQQEYTYAAVNVPVKELVEFIKSVQAQKGEVLYIHDF